MVINSNYNYDNENCRDNYDDEDFNDEDYRHVYYDYNHYYSSDILLQMKYLLKCTSLSLLC